MRIASVSVLVLSSIISVNAFRLGLNRMRKTSISMNDDSLSSRSNVAKKFFSKAVPILLSFGLMMPPSGPMPAAYADETVTTAPWDSGIKYSIIKSGTGDKPKVGDIVAIRFKGSYKGNVFDDTFATFEPYLYRCGVGSIVKGLDDSVLQMKVGDRWKLTFGGDLAFGKKGKPSAPGKPRIPPNAEIDYEVEFVELPGKGEDTILDVE
mmetsp:Transcript_24359/g.24620  ORF Transcript_24359/g.24620 Transcript_24359/m.24620 type:complete len:208 (+) Transcript_24359:71-694(+)|eukprot:CAMPEP_0182419264 /NCGR_PEP_ID=MMETSP1167-20130531/3708_1 /TAXON_ID=2988 /ORGANISM="Mallomonas Sp, Strain CCMP3275" /LENGTH=207 /DNA_ID=CAMNT_0024594047 /DNA_START=71 /DNA_END=694 /DNA_ORIENTATION=+